MIILKIAELEQFYERWNEKINSYVDNELNSIFDKFFSLFVIYNRLYNVVTVVLKESGELSNMRANGIIDKKPKIVRDNKAATICVAHYLNNEIPTIITSLQDELDIFQTIINDEIFFIDMYYGTPQRDKDLSLLKGLQSLEERKVFLSLLEILYNLRCNMFHGEKGLNYDQKMILKPAITSLLNINSVLMNKLKTET